MIFKHLGWAIVLMILLSACDTREQGEQTLPTRVSIIEATEEETAQDRVENTAESTAESTREVETTAEIQSSTREPERTAELTVEPMPEVTVDLGVPLTEAARSYLLETPVPTELPTLTPSITPQLPQLDRAGTSALATYDALIDVIEIGAMQWMSVTGSEAMGWRFEFATEDQSVMAEYMVNADGTYRFVRDELTSIVTTALERATLEIDSTDAFVIAKANGLDATSTEETSFYLYVNLRGQPEWVVSVPATAQAVFIDAVTGDAHEPGSSG